MTSSEPKDNTIPNTRQLSASRSEMRGGKTDAEDSRSHVRKIHNGDLITYGEAGVLFAGSNGTGKSTLAAILLGTKESGYQESDSKTDWHLVSADLTVLELLEEESPKLIGKSDPELVRRVLPASDNPIHDLTEAIHSRLLGGTHINRDKLKGNGAVRVKYVVFLGETELSLNFPGVDNRFEELGIKMMIIPANRLPRQRAANDHEKEAQISIYERIADEIEKFVLSGQESATRSETRLEASQVRELEQGVKFFDGEAGVTDQRPQSPAVENAMIGDRKVNAETMFREDDVRTKPAQYPSRLLEGLDRFKTGNNREMGHLDSNLRDSRRSFLTSSSGVFIPDGQAGFNRVPDILSDRDKGFTLADAARNSRAFRDISEIFSTAYQNGKAHRSDPPDPKDSPGPKSGQGVITKMMPPAALSLRSRSEMRGGAEGDEELPNLPSMNRPQVRLSRRGWIASNVAAVLSASHIPFANLAAGALNSWGEGAILIHPESLMRYRSSTGFFALYSLSERLARIVGERPEFLGNSDYDIYGGYVSLSTPHYFASTWLEQQVAFNPSEELKEILKQRMGSLIAQTLRKIRTKDPEWVEFLERSKRNSRDWSFEILGTVQHDFLREEVYRVFRTNLLPEILPLLSRAVRIFKAVKLLPEADRRSLFAFRLKRDSQGNNMPIDETKILKMAREHLTTKIRELRKKSEGARFDFDRIERKIWAQEGYASITPEERSFYELEIALRELNHNLEEITADTFSTRSEVREEELQKSDKVFRGTAGAVQDGAKVGHESGSDVADKNISFLQLLLIFFDRPKIQTDGFSDIGERFALRLSLRRAARKFWSINAVTASSRLFFDHNFIFHIFPLLSRLIKAYSTAVYNTSSLPSQTVDPSTSRFSRVTPRSEVRGKNNESEQRVQEVLSYQSVILQSAREVIEERLEAQGRGVWVSDEDLIRRFLHSLKIHSPPGDYSHLLSALKALPGNLIPIGEGHAAGPLKPAMDRLLILTLKYLNHEPLKLPQASQPDSPLLIGRRSVIKGGLLALRLLAQGPSGAVSLLADSSILQMNHERDARLAERISPLLVEGLWRRLRIHIDPFVWPLHNKDLSGEIGLFWTADEARSTNEDKVRIYRALLWDLFVVTEQEIRRWAKENSYYVHENWADSERSLETRGYYLFPEREDYERFPHSIREKKIAYWLPSVLQHISSDAYYDLRPGTGYKYGVYKSHKDIGSLAALWEKWLTMEETAKSFKTLVFSLSDEMAAEIAHYLPVIDPEGEIILSGKRTFHERPYAGQIREYLQDQSQALNVKAGQFDRDEMERIEKKLFAPEGYADVSESQRKRYETWVGLRTRQQELERSADILTQALEGSGWSSSSLILSAIPLIARSEARLRDSFGGQVRGELIGSKQMDEFVKRHTRSADQGPEGSGFENSMMRNGKDRAYAGFFKNDVRPHFPDDPAGPGKGLHRIQTGDVRGKFAHEITESGVEKLGRDAEDAALAVAAVFPPRPGVHNLKHIPDRSPDIAPRLSDGLSLADAARKGRTLGYKSTGLIGINNDVPFHKKDDSRRVLKSQAAGPRSEARQDEQDLYGVNPHRFEFAIGNDFPFRGWNVPFNFKELTDHWKRWRKGGGVVEGLLAEEMTGESLFLDYGSESFLFRYIPFDAPDSMTAQYQVVVKLRNDVLDRSAELTFNFKRWSANYSEGKKVSEGGLTIELQGMIKEGGRVLPPFWGSAFLSGDANNIFDRVQFENGKFTLFLNSSTPEGEWIPRGHTLDAYGISKEADEWLKNMGFSWGDRFNFQSSRFETRLRRGFGGQVRGGYRDLNDEKKSLGVRMGMPRNGFKSKRSESPETMTSALAESAHSKTASSFGSRQAWTMMLGLTILADWWMSVTRSEIFRSGISTRSLGFEKVETISRTSRGESTSPIYPRVIFSRIFLGNPWDERRAETKTFVSTTISFIHFLAGFFNDSFNRFLAQTLLSLAPVNMPQKDFPSRRQSFRFKSLHQLDFVPFVQLINQLFNLTKINFHSRHNSFPLSDTHGDVSALLTQELTRISSDDRNSSTLRSEMREDLSGELWKEKLREFIHTLNEAERNQLNLSKENGDQLAEVIGNLKNFSELDSEIRRELIRRVKWDVKEAYQIIREIVTVPPVRQEPQLKDEEPSPLQHRRKKIKLDPLVSIQSSSEKLDKRDKDEGVRPIQPFAFAEDIQNRILDEPIDNAMFRLPVKGRLGSENLIALKEMVKKSQLDLHIMGFDRNQIEHIRQVLGTFGLRLRRDEESSVSEAFHKLETKTWWNGPIETLGLPRRLTRPLKNAGINTVGELLLLSIGQLRSRVRGVGDVGYSELEKRLKELGLTLREDWRATRYLLADRSKSLVRGRSLAEMRSREEAVKILEEKNANPKELVWAIRTLRNFQATEHTALIAGFTAYDQGRRRGSAAFVRQAAVVTLGRWGARDYHKQIAARLDDTDSEVVNSAIAALQKLENGDYVERVQDLVEKGMSFTLFRAVDNYLKIFTGVGVQGILAQESHPADAPQSNPFDLGAEAKTPEDFETHLKGAFVEGATQKLIDSPEEFKEVFDKLDSDNLKKIFIFYFTFHWHFNLWPLVSEAERRLRIYNIWKKLKQIDDVLTKLQLSAPSWHFESGSGQKHRQRLEQEITAQELSLVNGYFGGAASLFPVASDGRSEAREIKGDGGRLKLEDNFFQHPASNFQLPKVDKAVQRAVWRRVSGHLPEFEPLIVDAKWVRWGGLAFVGTVSEAPFHAVVADKIEDADVIQLVQDYKRRFPKRIIFVAESVAEAQEKLLEQLALLGGTTERLWNIRGLTTPDSEENIFPEMIRELGRDQVSVIPRSEFRRMVERAGIEDWVRALSLEDIVHRSA